MDAESYFQKVKCSAGGGIRTPVATRAPDLQSGAIDRSATPAKNYQINFIKEKTFLQIILL